MELGLTEEITAVTDMHVGFGSMTTADLCLDISCAL